MAEPSQPPDCKIHEYMKKEREMSEDRLRKMEGKISQEL